MNFIPSFSINCSCYCGTAVLIKRWKLQGTKSLKCKLKQAEARKILVFLLSWRNYPKLRRGSWCKCNWHGVLILTFMGFHQLCRHLQTAHLVHAAMSSLTRSGRAPRQHHQFWLLGPWITKLHSLVSSQMLPLIFFRQLCRGIIYIPKKPMLI